MKSIRNYFVLTFLFRSWIEGWSINSWSQIWSRFERNALRQRTTTISNFLKTSRFVTDLPYWEIRRNYEDACRMKHVKRSILVAYLRVPSRKNSFRKHNLLSLQFEPQQQISRYDENQVSWKKKTKEKDGNVAQFFTAYPVKRWTDRHLNLSRRLFFDTLTEPARIDSDSPVVWLWHPIPVRVTRLPSTLRSPSLSPPPFERQLNGIKVFDEKEPRLPPSVP